MSTDMPICQQNGNYKMALNNLKSGTYSGVMRCHS